MFFQQLVNGLSIGSIYALMAVGYSLIYSLLNFTNFAHSITVTIAAFSAFYFMSYIVGNLYLGIFFAVIVSGVVAMLIELLGYRPLLKKKAKRIYLLITGLGISTMCENLIIFMKYVGKKAIGFRATGAVLPETERWMYSDGGFLYSSCGISGEACDYYRIAGVPTEAVNIPCRDEQMDDYVQTVLNSYPQVLVGMPRIAPYENAYRNWVHEIEGIVRYGNSGSTAFHPQIAGTPGRAVMFRRFCEYLAENKDVWCAPCEEIARYFIAAKEGNGVC